MAGAKIRGSRDTIANVESTSGTNEVERISAMIAEAERIGPAYWHSRTPQERVLALELMRRRAYGYDRATARIEKVIEILHLRDI